MRPAMLFAEVAVLRLDEAALLADPELAAADPALDSLWNINEPAEYRAARDRPAPEVVLRSPAGLATVRAATLGALGPSGPVVLNGVLIAYDAELPLVAGDTVDLT